jgi:hypothetical protein
MVSTRMVKTPRAGVENLPGAQRGGPCRAFLLSPAGHQRAQYTTR